MRRTGPGKEGEEGRGKRAPGRVWEGGACRNQAKRAFRESGRQCHRPQRGQEGKGRQVSWTERLGGHGDPAEDSGTENAEGERRPSFSLIYE